MRPGKSSTSPSDLDLLFPKSAKRSMCKAPRRERSKAVTDIVQSLKGIKGSYYLLKDLN